MATTTLKLPEELKVRIAPLAAAAGKTAHAWMIEAIQAQVALSDLKASFIQEGRDSASQIDAGGPVYAMEDVAAYLRGRLTDANRERPQPMAGSGVKRRTQSGRRAR